MFNGEQQEPLLEAIVKRKGATIMGAATKAATLVPLPAILRPCEPASDTWPFRGEGDTRRKE